MSTHPPLPAPGVIATLLTLIVCAALFPACIWDSTLDSASGHVGVRLTSHFEGLPAWGTSRNFHLEVDGYEPVSVRCSKGDGQVSEAHDGHRVAYECGDGWKIVYVETGALFEACTDGPKLTAIDWATQPQFPAAAAALAKCNALPALVKALEASHGAKHEQVVTLILDVFERECPSGFASELKGMPADVQSSVRAKLQPRLIGSDVLSVQQLETLVDLYGVDDGAEEQFLPNLERASPTNAQSSHALIHLLFERRGLTFAAKAACTLNSRWPHLQGVALGVLAQTTVPCARFEKQIAEAMDAPTLACSGDLSCTDNVCTAPMPERWDDQMIYDEDDQQAALLHAAILRGLAPHDLALSVRRREYIVEMPETPDCSEAKHGKPCRCDLQLCSAARAKGVDEFDSCKITFDDRRKHVTVTAR